MRAGDFNECCWLMFNMVLLFFFFFVVVFSFSFLFLFYFCIGSCLI